jgi:DNA modification methylase
VAALQLARNFVGVELSPDNVETAQIRVSDTQMGLPNIAEKREEYQVVDMTVPSSPAPDGTNGKGAR